MNSNKKILFILPTLSKGGQERAASRLSFVLPNSFEKFLIVFYKVGEYGILMAPKIPKQFYLFK
jgi:hypothetical protein